MSLSSPDTSEVASWGPELMSALNSLSDDLLGVSTLQAAYDGFTYNAPVDNSHSHYESEVATMANVLRSRAVSKKDVVENLATETRSKWSQGTGSTEYTQCCSVSTSSLYWDPVFLSTKVDKQETCVRVPGSTTRSGTAFNNDLRATSALQSTFESQLDNEEGLAWQYVGMEASGIFRIHPRNRASSCGSYDPRFRPWYVLASQPQPKNLIIIIDVSGSMGSQGRLALAKEAALTALSTLNPLDHVGVVAFSSTALTPTQPDQHECMQTHLAPATPGVVANLQEYIDSLRDGGGTYYNNAFNKAFSMLENTRNQNATGVAGGLEAILFLTDGVQSDSATTTRSILQNAKDEADGAGRTLKVFVYGLGSGITGDTTARNALTNMADIFETQAEFIGDGGDLRSRMGRWYAEVGGTPSSDPVFTAPYFDVSGLGMVVTVAQPVMSGGTLIGVAGADISLEELAEEVGDFGAEEGGARWNYGILLDTEGTALIHPSLPPLSGWADSPPRIDIADLEPHSGFDTGVRGSMLSETSGHATLNVTRVVSRGDVPNAGLHHAFGSGLVGGKEVDVEQTYYWSHVTGTPYIVVIVVSHFRTPASLQSSLAGVDFSGSLTGEMRGSDVGAGVYHRVDLYDNEAGGDDLDKCQYAVSSGIALSQGYSSYKLAPRAFTAPFAYLTRPESEECVERLNSAEDMGEVLQGTSSGWGDCSVPTQEAVRDVFATRSLDSFWRTRSTNDDGVDFALWRYVGTSSGVWRVFPGHPSSKRYDPTQRPWYTLAASRPSDECVVTTPYLDATTGTPVITLAQGIAPLVGGAQDTNSTAAVAAVDFSLGKFADMVLQASVDGSATRCDSAFRRSNSGYRTDNAGRVLCFVMDDRGLIVYHPAFLLHENPELAQLAETTHRDVTGSLDTVEDVLDDVDLSSVFVGTVEPMVAKDLMARNLLTRSTCVDVSERASVTTYSVDSEVFDTISVGSILESDVSVSPGVGSTYRDRYTMQRVEGSNLYLLTVEAQEESKGGGGCTCDNVMQATTLTGTSLTHQRVDGQCSQSGGSMCTSWSEYPTEGWDDVGPCRCALDWNSCFGGFSNVDYWFGELGEVEVSPSGSYPPTPFVRIDTTPVCPAGPVPLGSDVDIEEDEHVTTAQELYDERLPECIAVRPTSCESVNEMFGPDDASTTLTAEEILEMAESCASLEGCFVEQSSPSGRQTRLRCFSSYATDLQQVEEDADATTAEELVEAAGPIAGIVGALFGVAVCCASIVMCKRKMARAKAAQQSDAEPVRPVAGTNPMPRQRQQYPHHPAPAPAPVSAQPVAPAMSYPGMQQSNATPPAPSGGGVAVAAPPAALGPAYGYQAQTGHHAGPYGNAAYPTQPSASAGYNYNAATAAYGGGPPVYGDNTAAHPPHNGLV